MLKTLSLSLLTLGLLLVTPAARADSGELPVEAREVLGRFIGEWEVSTVVNGTAHRGVATCSWTMEGRYAEFRSQTIPAGESDLQIMTYSDGRYHHWLFESSGYRHVVEGHWDAATSTLTWTAPGLKIIDHWVSPDRLEWTLERKDRRIQGVVSRRFPGPKK